MEEHKKKTIHLVIWILVGCLALIGGISIIAINISIQKNYRLIYENVDYTSSYLGGDDISNYYIHGDDLSFEETEVENQKPYEFSINFNELRSKNSDYTDFMCYFYFSIYVGSYSDSENSFAYCPIKILDNNSDVYFNETISISSIYTNCSISEIKIGDSVTSFSAQFDTVPYKRSYENSKLETTNLFFTITNVYLVLFGVKK